MTSRERLLTVLRGEIPDYVPCTPDTSQMIPARLTGKLFWDIFLYQDPPQWKAYIDCVKHFGFDGFLDAIMFEFPEEQADEPPWQPAIIARTPDRIITQDYYLENGKPVWRSEYVSVYFPKDSPTRRVRPETIGLPPKPEKWEPVEGIRQWPNGAELIKLMKEQMGEHGLVGCFCGTTRLLRSEEDILRYYDDPGYWRQQSAMELEKAERRFELIMQCHPRPDFIACGRSGSLIYQTPQMLRELALPILQRVTALAKAEGIPTQIHSCGPEKALVQMVAEETDLTVIDPLEIPPMGDCNLKELKQKYGKKLVLKGNLHTIEVMLQGTVEEVIAASRQAIDDAAEGGRFILSTGDQTPRDAPDENIYAMMETARTYGRY